MHAPSSFHYSTVIIQHSEFPCNTLPYLLQGLSKVAIVQRQSLCMLLFCRVCAVCLACGKANSAHTTKEKHAEAKPLHDCDF